jgi:hypothetical protein
VSLQDVDPVKLTRVARGCYRYEADDGRWFEVTRTTALADPKMRWRLIDSRYPRLPQYRGTLDHAARSIAFLIRPRHRQEHTDAQPV